MARKNDEIGEYLLNNVNKHPYNIVHLAASSFNVTRQTASRRIGQLVTAGLIVAEGKTKARKYELKKLVDKIFPLDVSQGFEEDIIWREQISPLLIGIPQNVLEICQYGVEEMLNNVISHSGANTGWIGVERDATLIVIYVADKGIGVFNKIQQTFGLHDPRHALLELAKGKLTSEQAHHTGEGIFFTSRMFDDFSILSGPLFYRRVNERGGDWLIEVEDRQQTDGTLIAMKISIAANQTILEIFNKSASGELNHDFSRTHVPVKLARYGTEQLVSRSQARRVLARFERFKEVLLDFKDVDQIGPAFADEIFRVYQNEHPELLILAMYTSPQVQEMIDRAKNYSVQN
jgi:anti-sigma regulatory factor (Ser/Thr protein kinase)